MIKFALMMIVITGGSFFAVKEVPSLHASILNVVNPRINQEAELLDALNEQLETVSTTIPGSSKAAAARAQKAIEEAQDLLTQIEQLNDDHSGFVDAAVTRVVDAVMPSTKNAPAPTPCAQE